MAMVDFRQKHRQEMMREISRHLLAIKPNAILGGNPGIGRRFDDPHRLHVHVPFLGETHHLVCAENARFPARSGETIRHQALLYKYGQSNRFAVFASHTPKLDDDTCRWPATLEECALSLCEGLAFGGHPLCTTWGIRMDGAEDKTVYQRPLFRQALDPVVSFLNHHGEIYRGASCNAAVGVYQNRESLCSDALNAWLSMQGAVQALLQNQIPFRLVDRDEERLCDGLELLIVPDVQLVSDAQIARFHAFAERGGRLLVTGASCRYDEWRLPRERSALDFLWAHPNVQRSAGTPEKLDFGSDEECRAYWGGSAGGKWHKNLPLPVHEAEFIARARDCLPPPDVEVHGSRFAAIDTFTTPHGRQYVHILNYDNVNPCNLTVTLRHARNIAVHMPDRLGTRAQPAVQADSEEAVVTLTGLHTYCVIGWENYEDT
jgi:hypothetical protein